MQRLSDVHKEQILSMNKDGKGAQEIQAFLKKEYGIDVTTGGIYYTIRAAGGKTTPRAKAAKKAKPVVADDSGGEDGNVVEEVIGLIKEIDAGYKAIFAHFRSELIKSRGEVHAIMRGAGIPVEGEDNGE